MKQTVFTGAATAIITPFAKDGSIDFESYGRMIDWQIESGINAIVSVGTTGENATLEDDEHQEALDFCIKRVNGRVPVIAGTGSNNTAHAINMSKCACDMGADALLVVTPYYNKATQKGLIASFEAIADSVSKPCILYNVPSRTGCNILPETAAVLARHPNIAAIKEASGDISQIAKTAELCGDDLDIYSGNDDQTVPILSLGGKGVISVLSNIMPAETAELCARFFRGDTKGALELQMKYLRLMNHLFCEVNPIPVKAACAAMGICKNVVRLPLLPMEAKNEEKLRELMREAGLKLK
ncbi:MAG: 4-hydroxy-tetrahydrodipicolinate synthase [Synergistes sp.]|nr:4-hydroxy-tetrahydrodipicolinate synthase [Synergistes sp.]